MQNILDFGVRLIVAIQGWGTWLALPMKSVSSLGTEDFFVLLLPLLYWCLDSILGIRTGIILMLSSKTQRPLPG